MLFCNSYFFFIHIPCLCLPFFPLLITHPQYPPIHSASPSNSSTSSSFILFDLFHISPHILFSVLILYHFFLSHFIANHYILHFPTLPLFTHLYTLHPPFPFYLCLSLHPPLHSASPSGSQVARWWWTAGWKGTAWRRRGSEDLPETHARISVLPALLRNVLPPRER